MKKNIQKSLTLLALLGTFALASCETTGESTSSQATSQGSSSSVVSSEGGTSSSIDVETSLSFEKESLTVEATKTGVANYELRLFVNGYDGDTVEDLLVKSSDESVLKAQKPSSVSTYVDEKGATRSYYGITVTTNARAGTATVTATLDGKEATCAVTVTTESVSLTDVGVEEKTISDLLALAPAEGNYPNVYYRVSGILTELGTGGSMTLVEKGTGKKLSVAGLAKDGSDLASIFAWRDEKIVFTNPVNFDDIVDDHHLDEGETEESNAAKVEAGDEITVVGTYYGSSLSGYFEAKKTAKEDLPYVLSYEAPEHGSLVAVDLVYHEAVYDEWGDLVSEGYYTMAEGSEKAIPSMVTYGEVINIVAQPEEGYALETISFGGIANNSPVETEDGTLVYQFVGGYEGNSIAATFKWDSPFPAPETKASSIEELLASEKDMDDNYYAVEGIVTHIENNPAHGKLTLVSPEDHSKSIEVTGLAAANGEGIFSFDAETGKLSFVNPENFATLFPEGGEAAIELGDEIKVTGIYTSESGFEGYFDSVVTPKEDIDLDVTLEVGANGSARLVNATYDEDSGDYLVSDATGTKYHYGDRIAIEVTPETGYEVESVLFNGIPENNAYGENGNLYFFAADLENKIEVAFAEASTGDTIIDVTIAELNEAYDTSVLYRVKGFIGYDGICYTLTDGEDELTFNYLAKDRESAEITYDDYYGYQFGASTDSMSDIYDVEGGVAPGTYVSVIAVLDSYYFNGYYEETLPITGVSVPLKITFQEYLEVANGGRDESYPLYVAFLDEEGNELPTVPSELEAGKEYSFKVVFHDPADASGYDLTVTYGGQELTASEGIYTFTASASGTINVDYMSL